MHLFRIRCGEGQMSSNDDLKLTNEIGVRLQLTTHASIGMLEGWKWLLILK